MWRERGLGHLSPDNFKLSPLVLDSSVSTGGLLFHTFRKVELIPISIESACIRVYAILGTLFLVVPRIDRWVFDISRLRR